MNRFFANLKLSALVLTLFLTAFSVCGQPAQKQAEAARAAFDEALRLRDENTFRAYQRALAKFEEAARDYEALGDRQNTGKSWLGIGLMKDLLGEKPAAREFYERALAVFREVGDQTSEARALNNLGVLLNDLGEKQKALEYHEQALRLRRITGDRSGEARTLNSLGVVYSNLGERKKALDYLKQSLALRRQLGESAEQAITLNNLGRVYDDLGEKKKALDYLILSLALRRAAADAPGEAIALNNIGMTLSDSEKPEAALGYYEKAVEIFSAIGLENQTAAVLNNIGELYLQLEQTPKSLEYSRRAIPLYRAAGDRGGEATALSNIGSAYLQLGENLAAAENFNQSLVLAQGAEEKDLEAIVLGNLMLAYQRLNNPAAAVFYGKQCVNRYQELRRAIKDLEKPTRQTYLKTIEDHYRRLADLLIETGRFAEAEQVLAMLKEEEYSEFVRRDPAEIKTLGQRVALSETEQRLLAEYSRLADDAAQTAAAFQKLDDQKRRRAQTGEALTPAEEKEYERLAGELAKANAAFKLFLEKTLVKEIGARRTRTIESDRALQEKLRQAGRGTIALTTVVTENRYRVIVTTSDLQTDGKTEIKSAELNQKIFAFREALKNPAAEPRLLGKELYDILVKPVENVLKASGAETLVWSLDGSLRYIPLAALSPDGETYLVERFRNVVLTPQTRAGLGASDGSWNALGMGVSTAQSVFYPDSPDEAVRLDALPAIEDELKTIIREPETPGEKGILTGRRFLNDDFTLKNLTDSLAKKSADGRKLFSVVHLASHFRLAKNWSDSFLVLGGGKLLTLEEIGSSPLIDFAGVDLVTLSACNTAAGEDSNGGEVDGLAGLIQMRNGRSVLATLWEVEDESTAALMSSFYRLRQENPQMTKAAAMQTAQKLMLYGGATPMKSPPPAGPKFRYDKSRPFAHPVYWAPFVLIGNWR